MRCRQRLRGGHGRWGFDVRAKDAGQQGLDPAYGSWAMLQ